MTGREAAIRLRAQLNQLDTASNRSVRPETALLFLNNAYSKLVEAKARKTHNGDITSFQARQFTTDELNYLTKPVSVTVTKTDGEDQYEANLSTVADYWVHLRSSIKVKKGNATRWVHNPNYKTLDTVGTAFDDPFNKSSYSEPILYFVDGKVIFPATGFEVVGYKLTFLKKPEEITMDGTILAPFEDDIIEKAARLMLENWGSQRAQSITAVNKSVEME